MRKNIKVILGIMVLAGLVSSSLLYQSTKANTLFSERVDALKSVIEQEKSDNSLNTIQGKNFVITDKEIELKTEVYKLKGDENPEEAAIKHLIERKVLLNKALEMGYTVTEKEIDEHIARVKEVVKETENYDDYLNFMKEYGGEETYWSDYRSTTRDTMIINQFLDYEKKKYYREKKDNLVVQFKANLLDDWNKQKANIIHELVQDQEVTVLDKSMDFDLSW